MMTDNPSCHLKAALPVSFPKLISSKFLEKNTVIRLEQIMLLLEQVPRRKCPQLCAINYLNN